MIDTSSPRSAVAVLQDGKPVAEDVAWSGRESDLPRRAARLVEPAELEAVVVALGPGSFTGLRVGVSYGLGLAMGLGIPLLGLGSLVLHSARALEPCTALVEAGRGRLYWLDTDSGQIGHGEPEQLPRGRPAVGWLRQEVAAAVQAAGLRLLCDGQVRMFGEAASRLLERAERLGYDTVRLQYMQSFELVRG